MNILNNWAIYLNDNNKEGIIIWTGNVKNLDKYRETIILKFSYDDNFENIYIDKYRIKNQNISTIKFERYVREFLNNPSLFYIEITEKDNHFILKSNNEYPDGSNINERYEYSDSNVKRLTVYRNNPIFKKYSDTEVITEYTKLDLNKNPDLIYNHLIYDNRKKDINVNFIKDILNEIFEKYIDYNELKKLNKRLGNVYIKLSGSNYLDSQNNLEKQFHTVIEFLSETPLSTRDIINYFFENYKNKDNVVFKHEITYRNLKITSSFILKDNLYKIDYIGDKLNYNFKFYYDDKKKQLNIYIEPENINIFDRLFQKIQRILINIYKDKDMINMLGEFFKTYKSFIQLNNKGKKIFDNINEFIKLLSDMDNEERMSKKDFEKIIDNMNILNYRKKKINGKIQKLSESQIIGFKNQLINLYKNKLETYINNICQ